MRLIILRQASFEKPSVFRSLSVSVRGPDMGIRPLWSHDREQIHSRWPTFADDPVQDGLQLCDTDLHVLLAQTCWTMVTWEPKFLITLVPAKNTLTGPASCLKRLLKLASIWLSSNCSWNTNRNNVSLLFYVRTVAVYCLTSFGISATTSSSSSLTWMERRVFITRTFRKLYFTI